MHITFLYKITQMVAPGQKLCYIIVVVALLEKMVKKLFLNTILILKNQFILDWRWNWKKMERFLFLFF